MNDYILSLTIFFSLLKKLDLEMLPNGSTIYYSRNKKCVIYRSDSKICLENEYLYNDKEIHQILMITNYSEYNYYELNLYEIDNSRINCIITYFLRTNELVFKYYNININGNRIEGQIDYIYYNDSLNPINKGINCQANYPDELICFYMNKDKDIVKMDIKPI